MPPAVFGGFARFRRAGSASSGKSCPHQTTNEELFSPGADPQADDGRCSLDADVWRWTRGNAGKDQGGDFTLRPLLKLCELGVDSKRRATFGGSAQYAHSNSTTCPQLHSMRMCVTRSPSFCSVTAGAAGGLAGECVQEVLARTTDAVPPGAEALPSATKAPEAAALSVVSGVRGLAPGGPDFKNGTKGEDMFKVGCRI